MIPGMQIHDVAQIYSKASSMHLKRPAGQRLWRLMRKPAKKAAADPYQERLRAQCRTEVRDGVKVTICPPAYAFGAARADTISVGFTGKSGGNRRAPA